jgi:hypothetical protein
MVRPDRLTAVRASHALHSRPASCGYTLTQFPQPSDVKSSSP